MVFSGFEGGLRGEVFLVQLRAAIYCRVSTSDQSCDRQRRDLSEYAARAGYEVVDVFEEKASGARCDRAQRKEILKLAQARKIDVVLCTELSRWGRSTADVVTTVNKLSSRGVSLICQNGLDFDLSSAHGQLVLSMLAALAEFERNLSNERVRSGLAAARARGKQLGRRRGRSPKTASKQAMVAALREQKMSIRKIAKQVQLSPTTVQTLLNSRS